MNRPSLGSKKYYKEIHEVVIKSGEDEYTYKVSFFLPRPLFPSTLLIFAPVFVRQVQRNERNEAYLRSK